MAEVKSGIGIELLAIDPTAFCGVLIGGGAMRPPPIHDLYQRLNLTGTKKFPDRWAIRSPAQ
jgi:hypothetical protein